MATPIHEAIDVSGDLRIDGLIEGGAWQFTGAHVLTYSLNTFSNGAAWTAADASAIVQALGAWAAVADIKFQQISSGAAPNQSTADLAITHTGNYLLQEYSAAGVSVFPDPAWGDIFLDGLVMSRGQYPKPEGDVFLDDSFLNLYNRPGAYGFTISVHEIGHALGLKHPHDDGGNGRPFLPAEYDNGLYTVMSYNKPTTLPSPLIHTYGNQSTPMPLDILAIQHIYGANTTYHTGNDTYRLTNDGIVRTVWDAGGIDTFDAGSLTFSVTIDLHEGKYVYHGSLGSITAIAYDAVIENAIGTSAVDTLLGNDADNILAGGGGNDTLDGGLGNDTLKGGAGNDTLDGGVGAGDTADFSDIAGGVTANLSVTDGSGNASAIAGTAIDLLQNIENLTGGAGNDVLTGEGSDNVLSGNAGNDTLNGGLGNDTLNGGLGNDTLAGGSGNDIYVFTGAAPESGDRINDSAGLDTIDFRAATGILALPATLLVADSRIEQITLTGTKAADAIGVNASAFDADLTILGTTGLAITGNAGANTITGTGGDDTIAGGAGNDAMTGGAGNDQIHGGIGNDSFFVNTGTEHGATEVIDGEDGVDTLYFTPTTASASAPANNLVMNADDDVEKVVIGTALSTAGTAALNVDASAMFNGLGVTIIGNSGINTLTGSQFTDSIDGGGGNDTLNGGAGNDSMNGGLGNDTYVVDDAGDTITDSAGIDTVQSSITYSLALQLNLENLTLTGSADLNGTGNALGNMLTGNAGNNILTGGLGNDTYIVSTGDSITEAIDGGIDLVQTDISYTLGDTLEHLTLTGTAAIDGTGNAKANTLIGNTGANVLDGGLGADILKGGKGNDTYVVMLNKVGAGATALAVLQDTVTENLSEGTDTLQLSAADLGLATATTLLLGANLENLDSSGTGSNKLNLTGNALANTLTGNAGNNVLDGGIGNDTLIGGAGNDSYLVDNLLDTITEGVDAGTDLAKISIATTNGSYTLAENVENGLLLNAVAFNLTGNALPNSLTGNAAANILDGGLGNDTLIGGLGNDTYVVDDAGDTITDSAGIDTVRSSIDYSLGAGLENLTLTGSADLDGTGNALANILTGNSGNNILTGGPGNDTYIVSTGDSITEAIDGGIDLVQTDISYTLGDTLEHLTLTGTAAIDGTGNAKANTLIGNIGANVLDGGAGIDVLKGGAGSDTYVVDLIKVGTLAVLQDTVTEILTDAGSDTLQLRTGAIPVLSPADLGLAMAATFTLGATLENLDTSLTGSNKLNLTGNALANILTGNAGNNVLDGGIGNDTLIGGGGNDTLKGGLGSDTLTGGDGADCFVFNALTGPDTVLDFVSETDKLAFDNLIFRQIGVDGTLAAGAFFSGAGATQGGDSGDRVVFDTTAGNLYYDADGLGGAASVQVAHLTGVSSLAAADILIA